MPFAVTVQIPFELIGAVPGYQSVPGSANITFLQNDTAIASYDLAAQTDSIHVITDCDALIPASTKAPNGLCDPLVTHADGSSVIATPAIAGETVVVYALGFGAVSPLPADGSASAGIASVTVPVFLNFDWSPNAQSLRIPYPALTPRSATYQAPAYVGLVPGSVGLYQINVSIPSAPSGVQACGPDVFSNLTITIIGLSSIDSAAICVAQGF